MKGIFSSFCIVTVIALGGIVVFGQNYKIKQSTSMQGMDMSSTVYVKGSRKRSESGGMMGMGSDVATIEQCDLNRTVQVSDKKKLYYVMETHEPSTKPAATPTKFSVTDKPKKGGTITYTSNITDTGERKQMFGLTARHLKTSMTTTSSPDACSPVNMSMETDGWYVDLPAFSCPAPIPNNPYSYGGNKAGCQDTVVMKSTGGGKLGFPLELTQTMHSGNNTFSSTLTTIEFSKAALDDALFNVPADYTLASNSQDLYGKPDFSAMMGGDQGTTDKNAGPAKLGTPPMAPDDKGGKKPGTIRIGVLTPTVRNSDPISTPALQSYLVSQLTRGKTEAIAVSSEAEARAVGCDYFLTSDFTKLKQSTAGKIGGMFGGMTGAPTAGKFDAQLDYSLVSLADGKSVVKAKAATKTETEVNQAAQATLSIEAQAVLAAAK